MLAIGGIGPLPAVPRGSHIWAVGGRPRYRQAGSADCSEDHGSASDSPQANSLHRDCPQRREARWETLTQKENPTFLPPLDPSKMQIERKCPTARSEPFSKPGGLENCKFENHGSAADSPQANPFHRDCPPRREARWKPYSDSTYPA